MVVGFVNSGIMYFREALGVIMGANIGTTVTAWILVLAVDKWGLPILGASAFVYLFSKREKVRYTALAVMGIGMVFFGLELMKNGLASVNDSPDFLSAFTLFRADSYFGVMKVALLGCILTMIIQSSSATMGIVIALASQGVISFDTSIALVVGANVGTTITAQLASIGANVDARRCAWFHTSFNLVGAVLVIAFFPLFLRLVFFLLENMMGISSIAVNGKPTLSASTSPTGIALVGTLFNCMMTLLFFPFLNQIASAIEWLIPHKRERVGGDQLYSLSLIEGKHGAVPMTALTIARHKMSQMSNRTVKMAASLESYFNGDDKEKSREDVFQGEAELDQSLREMSKMATDLLGEPLSLQDINEVKTLLKMSEEYESVSDYLAQILKLYLRLEAAGLSLEPAQNKEMMELFQHTYELLLSAAEIELQEDAREYLPKMETKGKAITAYVRKSRDAHWKRLAEGSMHPLASTVYSDLLNAYRKIKNHLFSAVQAQAGE